MFGYLSQHSQILVTGPQRSGTRICSKMIVSDLENLGYKYIDECDFHEENRDELEKILSETPRCIVQCPALSYCIHEFPDEVAVIFMIRHTDAIKRSEERINWACEWHELQKYKEEVFPGRIATVKYQFWQNMQKPLIKFPYEILYESLRQHPMFVSEEKRKNFRWNQTEL